MTFAIFICVALLLLGMSMNAYYAKERKNENATQNNYHEVYRVDNFHNGDAKFWDDNIVTSTAEGLQILKYNEGKYEVKSYPEIKANWIDAIGGEDFIVYSNFEREIGIVSFDDELNVKSNNIIMNLEHRGIDVNIIKIEGVYYLTATIIEGEVNNADVNKPNGEYSVMMYESSDLKEWKEVGKVLEEDYNLEDIDISYVNETMYLAYEQETVDKSDSSINLIVSKDRGKTWDASIVLISGDGDNELAKFMKVKGGWELYYSSDSENSGGSYDKAKAYRAHFDENFKLLSTEKLNTNIDIGVLLYDIKGDGIGTKIVFAQNYSTDCNLVVEGS